MTTWTDEDQAERVQTSNNGKSFPKTLVGVLPVPRSESRAIAKLLVLKIEGIIHDNNILCALAISGD